MHPFFTCEHEAFRAAVRRFVRAEITPFAAEWDEAAEFPRELYVKAARAGLLGLRFPEQYGGCEADVFMRVLPGILSGEKISALAITEPSGGSDVAALKTTARLDGNEYIVNGSKMFITSGMRADYYTVAVRTGVDKDGTAQKGAAGVSLLLIERERAGFTRTPLKKMGWWASDTAALYFDNVRVPAANLIGDEGRGFKAIMANFNDERLGMVASATGFAYAAYEDALLWARERETFGQRLAEHQVIRHKLVDMRMKIEAARAMRYDCAWRVQQTEDAAHGGPQAGVGGAMGSRTENGSGSGFPPNSPLKAGGGSASDASHSGELAEHIPLAARLAMLKNFTTQTMQFCADQAVQILGGAGFMRGSRAERIYREVKVMMIGGGSEEMMKDLAAKQMGY